MQIIILTPDRVGSTLLQRLITVYANINENYDPLTVNLHELTNGLVHYHNPKFDRFMLGKHASGWGYHQTLGTITSMLDGAEHDIVSRLAHYHIKNRNDPKSDQLDFYRYLNENFYVIACRRQNLFEHALSWAIAVESKKLNVYSHQEKYEIYKDMHEKGFDVQSEVLEKYLRQYAEYMDWVDRHFQVNRYFEYERDMACIEDFILSLGPFKSHERSLTWQDRFDISWNDWNRVHYLLSLVAFGTGFTEEDQVFMDENMDAYTKARICLQDLQDEGILVSGIPIKLHTLKEKSMIIKNAPQCLEYYNDWVNQNPGASAITYEPAQLQHIAMIEQNHWKQDRQTLLPYSGKKTKLLASDLKST